MDGLSKMKYVCLSRNWYRSPKTKSREVEDYKWIDWTEFQNEIELKSRGYSYLVCKTGQRVKKCTEIPGEFI